MFAQPFVAGERGPAAVGDAVEVLAGEQARSQRAPGGQAQADVVVEAGVLLLDPLPPKQVVLRLLHRPACAGGGGRRCPRRRGSRRPTTPRCPSRGPCPGDDVGHGPHRLLDGCLRVGPVAEDQVDEVEAEPLQRAVDGLEEVLPVEGVAHVDARGGFPRRAWSRPRSCGGASRATRMASPMIRSDSPAEYASALSKKLTPASWAAARQSAARVPASTGVRRSPTNRTTARSP